MLSYASRNVLSVPSSLMINVQNGPASLQIRRGQVGGLDNFVEGLPSTSADAACQGDCPRARHFLPLPVYV